MLNFISRTPILIGLFLAMLVIGYLFGGVREASGGVLLDTIWNGADAKAHLLAMTAEQKSAHFWGTAVNDMLYPFAYGGLFAGLAWRFGGHRFPLVIPAMSVIIVDLAENTTQALALAGNDGLIGLKDVLTPLKFGLFLLAVVIAVFCLIGALIQKLRSRANQA